MYNTRFVDVETNGHTVILEDFSKWFNPKWVFGLVLELKRFTNIEVDTELTKFWCKKSSTVSFEYAPYCRRRGISLSFNLNPNTCWYHQFLRMKRTRPKVNKSLFVLLPCLLFGLVWFYGSQSLHFFIVISELFHTKGKKVTLKQSLYTSVVWSDRDEVTGNHLEFVEKLSI